jgi:hypothetical protein
MDLFDFTGLAVLANQMPLRQKRPLKRRSPLLIQRFLTSPGPSESF